MAIKKVWRKRKKKLVWGYDEWVKDAAGKPQRLRVFDFDTRDEAVEALGILLGKEKQAVHGLIAPVQKPLLSDLIKKRLATLKPGNQRTRETRVLVEWLALLDPSVDAAERDVSRVFSKVAVTNIGTAEIRLYGEKREREGCAAASIKREMVIIAAMIHQAAEFFPGLAQWRPPKVPYPKVSKSRREKVIGEEDYERLLECLLRPAGPLDGNRLHDQENARKARLRVAQILQFAMLTGARHGEIVKLRWKDVLWEQGRLLIYQTKTDRYKQIPITEPLARILKERQKPDNKPLDYVFSKGGNINPKFYRILKTACEMCDIPYGRDTADGIVLHTARHTVTTRLVSDGLDFDTIGQITGHSARELIAHYTHHSPASMARAAESLAKLGQSGHQLDKNEKPHK